MAICVVVADDHGARQASHALRAAGWGGVAFEANVDAAHRTAAEHGRACVLNVSRLADGEADALLAEPWAHDWRTPPPELSLDEWLVLYGSGDFTPRTQANRLKTATEKLGDAFEHWRLPPP